MSETLDQELAPEETEPVGMRRLDPPETTWPSSQSA
jgi:hypothetical protein